MIRYLFLLLILWGGAAMAQQTPDAVAVLLLGRVARLEHPHGHPPRL